jgi:ATP-dependent RNA helicase DDX24/MAK5
MDEEDEDELPEDAEGDGEGSDRLPGLSGLPGEAKVVMLTQDILDKLDQQRSDGSFPEPFSECKGHGDGESDTWSQNEGPAEDTDDADTDEAPRVVRRTYVYSATLTLPATSQSLKKHRNHDVDGAIAEILEKSRAHGRTKIVDLTTNSVGKKGSTTGHRATGSDLLSARKPSETVVATVDSVQLPPGLSLHHIKCTQKHKDSHLYAYLMTTEEGAKGPCLVFCNSIAAVRRVGGTLMTLGMEVRTLHAQMQQVRCLQRWGGWSFSQ